MPDAPAAPPFTVPARPQLRLPWVEPLMVRNGCAAHESPSLQTRPTGATIEVGCNRDTWLNFATASNAMQFPSVPHDPMPEDTCSFAVLWGTPAATLSRPLSRPRIVPVRLPQLDGHLRTGPNVQMPLLRTAEGSQTATVDPSWHDRLVQISPDGIRIRDRQVHVHWSKPAVHFWPYANAHAAYVGFEFESEYTGSNNCTIIPLVYHACDQMHTDLRRLTSSSPTQMLANRFNRRRLYVEDDSTLTNGREIITMPHMVRKASTYEALTRIFGTICTKAHDTSGHCGMHMHLSRTYINGGGPRQARVLDYLTALVLSQAKAMTVGKFFTGRQRESTYSNICWKDHVVNDVQRSRQINWENDATLEFRWPGPGGFKSPTWPCVVHDLCLALCDTAAILSSTSPAQLSTPSCDIVNTALHSGGVYQRERNASRLRNHAMICLHRVIAARQDEYPFAFDHLFLSPNKPMLYQGNI